MRINLSFQENQIITTQHFDIVINIFFFKIMYEYKFWIKN